MGKNQKKDLEIKGRIGNPPDRPKEGTPEKNQKSRLVSRKRRGDGPQNSLPRTRTCRPIIKVTRAKEWGGKKKTED